MNAPSPLQTPNGNSRIIFRAYDPLADVVPVGASDDLGDRGYLEPWAIPPNGLGCCLPLGVAFARCLRLLVVLLPRPLRPADQLLADQFDDLDRDRNIRGALIFLRQPAKFLVTGFDDGEKPGKSCLRYLWRLEQLGHCGTQGADIRAACLLRHASFRHFLPGSFRAARHVSPNTCEPLNSTMPKRGAPARMASAI